MAEFLSTEVTHEHEEITVEEIALADAGTLAELKLLMLVQTLRLRRPELFGGGAACTLPVRGLRACNVRTDLGRLAMPPSTTGGQ